MLGSGTRSILGSMDGAAPDDYHPTPSRIRETITSLQDAILIRGDGLRISNHMKEKQK
jgi:hypothetical protein